MLESRVIKNMIAQLLTRALELGSMLVFTIVIGRVWGVEELGKFSIIVTFAALFLFATDAGLNLLLIRELARYKERSDKYVSASLIWTLACSSITIIIMIMIAKVLGYTSDLQWGIFLGGIWMGIGTLTLVIRGVFYAFERMELWTITITVERCILLGAGLGVFIVHGSLKTLMIVLVISRIVNLFLSSVLYNKYIGHIKLGFDWGVKRHLILAAIPFGLNTLATAIYVQSDVVVLSYFRTVGEVGFYRAAAALVLPLITIPIVLNNALMPTLARAFTFNEQNKFISIFRKSFQYLLATSMPIAVIMMVLADRLIMMLYGRGFDSAVPALQILGVIIPIRFINNSMATVLTAVDRQAIRTWIVALAAVFNLSINLLIVPAYGFIGTSVIKIITEVIILTMLYYYVQKYIAPGSMVSISLRPILSGSAMALVLLILQPWPLLPLLTVGVFMYIVVLHVIGGLPKADAIRLIRGVRLLPRELHKTWSGR